MSGELKSVDSSSISHVGYDAEKSELIVKFHNGGVYSFPGVSGIAHQALLTAESVGQHFQEHIRAKFTGKRTK